MNKVKIYVDGLFSGLRETPQITEQKDEIIADINAKIIDLVSQGESENKALGIALESLGNFDDLLEEYRTIQDEEDKQVAKRRAEEEERDRKLAEEMARPSYVIRKNAFFLHVFAYAGLASTLVGGACALLRGIDIYGQLGISMALWFVGLFIISTAIVLVLWHRDHTSIKEIRPNPTKEYLWALAGALIAAFVAYIVSVTWYWWGPESTMLTIIAWVGTLLFGGVFVKQQMLKRGMFLAADDEAVEAKGEPEEAEGI